MESKQNYPTKYCVVPGTKEYDGAFGLEAICTKTGETLSRHDDICSDFTALTHLAQRLEEEEVHPIHLLDILEDFIDDYYG